MSALSPALAKRRDVSFANLIYLTVSIRKYGQRLPKCGTQQVNRELAAGLSTELREVLEPLLQEIESLNERIKEYDERVEKIAKEVYPEVSLLKQVKGVGTQITLTYVLTIEDPYRFPKSRAVGCFLGLKTIQERLGHALSGSLTLDIYTHAETAENVDAAQRAGDAIEKAMNFVSLTAVQEEGPAGGVQQALDNKR